MGVFYRKDRLRVVETGDFWLSDTPEVPGSISWGNLYPRMVTWALFEPSSDQRRFYLFNTHLPYRDEDDAARERGARLIASRLALLPADIPVIVTGDFNTPPDSRTHAVLATTSRTPGTRRPSNRPARHLPRFHRQTRSPHRLDPLPRHAPPLRADDHHPPGRPLSFRSFSGSCGIRFSAAIALPLRARRWKGSSKGTDVVGSTRLGECHARSSCRSVARHGCGMRTAGDPARRRRTATDDGAADAAGGSHPRRQVGAPHAAVARGQGPADISGSTRRCARRPQAPTG